MNNEMRVTKRNGDLQDMFFDKILNRVKKTVALDVNQGCQGLFAFRTHSPHKSSIAIEKLDSNILRIHFYFYI